MRALSGVPLVAFAGERDTMVPVGSIRSALGKLGPGAMTRLIVIPTFDHRCCWVRDWKRLCEMAAP